MFCCARLKTRECPALPHASCALWGKAPIFLQSPFLHLSNGGENNLSWNEYKGEIKVCLETRAWNILSIL